MAFTLLANQKGPGWRRGGTECRISGDRRCGAFWRHREGLEGVQSTLPLVSLSVLSYLISVSHVKYIKSSNKKAV